MIAEEDFNVSSTGAWSSAAGSLIGRPLSGVATRFGLGARRRSRSDLERSGERSSSCPGRARRPLRRLNRILASTPATFRKRGEARRVVLVVGFMGFCIAQSLTGFVYDLIGRQPWAVRVIDDLFQAVFLKPLGQVGGTAALLVLTVVLALLAYRRGVRERLA